MGQRFNLDHSICSYGIVSQDIVLWGFQVPTQCSVQWSYRIPLILPWCVQHELMALLKFGTGKLEGVYLLTKIKLSLVLETLLIGISRQDILTGHLALTEQVLFSQMTVGE